MSLWHMDWTQLTAEHPIQVLRHAIDKYGCPRKLLTDRGSQLYANEGEHGIKHILCRVNHPQTNGKLERFYGVYEQKRHQFKIMDEYVCWHNEVKPHLSLKIVALETPSQAFHRRQPTKQEKTETTHGKSQTSTVAANDKYACEPWSRTDEGKLNWKTFSTRSLQR